MSKFRSPQRRNVRQRSGFSVSGDNKGSTCKVLSAYRIHPEKGEILVHCSIKSEQVPILFKKNYGIFGVGYYFKSSGLCEALGKVSWKQGNKSFSDIIPLVKINSRNWLKNGALFTINSMPGIMSINEIEIDISFKTSSPISFWGLTSGSITHPYLIDNDISESFSEKTSIYIPEILYLDPTTQNQKFTLKKGVLDKKTGDTIVCKSCNRCSRFLPIDIENEVNTLGYSNHCVSRAPCKHSAFSSYKIELKEVELPSKLSNGKTVLSHFGHQLECKVCKKFFVNLPLNPLRDSTQHREDSLRRRAFEVLANQLLERKWIYHLHRLSTGKEFDVAIWEKFGKKCFNCDTPLPMPTDMHLDHTLPLAYLWPLDETATCLCDTCNSSKSDKFPIDFYPEDKLPLLSKVTGLPLTVLKSRPINEMAVKELFKRVVWFFKEFLAGADYQKIRKGKKTSDLILHALHNVLHSKGHKIDLVQFYFKKTGIMPTTVSIDVI